MKATIEDTTELAAVDGVLVRVWKGTLASGLEVTMYVALIGVPDNTPPEQVAELEHRLFNVQPQPQPARPQLDMQTALLAFVGAAKRGRNSIQQAIQGLIRTWTDVCGECGEAYTLHDSRGARMCTSCADPEDIRAFMDVEHEPHA